MQTSEKNKNKVQIEVRLETTTGTVKSLSKTFKKLSKGSYTVKVRAFGKTTAGKTVWGAKSKAKKVSVK